MPSFLESPRFPDNVSRGVSFGPEYITVITQSMSGYEQRNKVRSRALSKGECSHSVKTLLQYQELVKFFRSVGGRHLGFRFKDWSDFQLTQAESKLVLIANTVNQFQISKNYEIATGFSEVRPIRKPVVGTTAVYLSGSPLTVGAAAGNYSIDNTTGVVTLVANQTKGVSTHTVGVTHQLTLSTAFSPNVVPGDKIALSGVTGTAATLLNGKVLTVMTVTTNVITVNVNTTGLAAASGVAAVYHQVGNLTATAEFDTPCRFDTDHMPASLTNMDTYSWGQIPIIEIIT